MTARNSQLDPEEVIRWQVASMCELLGLKVFTPKKLEWLDTIYYGRGSGIPVPVDYLYIGNRKMVLSKRMQGVLTPEEWKPLIGSSLLFRSLAGPRFRKTLLPAVLIGIIYYVPVLLLATQTTIFGGASFFLTNPAFIIVVMFLAFFLLARRASPAVHAEMLKADLKVAGLVGKETFLAVLQKIENMRFQDVQKLDRKRGPYRQPSVQERIQNLQTGPTLPLSN